MVVVDRQFFAELSERWKEMEQSLGNRVVLEVIQCGVSTSFTAVLISCPGEESLQ